MKRLLWKVEEAAGHLGISRSKAYELVAAGKLPVIKLGGALRIPVDLLKMQITKAARGTKGHQQ